MQGTESVHVPGGVPVGLNVLNNALDEFEKVAPQGRVALSRFDVINAVANTAVSCDRGYRLGECLDQDEE